jgi:hypothetical protein
LIYIDKPVYSYTGNRCGTVVQAKQCSKLRQPSNTHRRIGDRRKQVKESRAV